MSALGNPVLINQNRSYWLSSIGADVIHSTIQVQEIDANVARISSLFADEAQISTLSVNDAQISTFAVSTLKAREFDVSGTITSSIKSDFGLFSTLSLISGDGINPVMTFSIDPSGVQVDGAPIRFDNLVYLTSTINIIQVSTLVDTDIFAANGRFSTLSTGSLSTGQANILEGAFSTLSSGSFSSGVASIRQANISSLYVSSLEGFDISGADPKEWSLYPTLNSTITFQPGNVLSNNGNSLFYNGRELTDVSGGGQDWSRFPAFSTVLMANNSLSGISTLIFQDGGRLTSLTGNNLQYNGQPIQVGNASNITQWASYPAVSSVNMNNFNLSNATSVQTSNLNVLGSNVTNGNTFTGTLSVGGTTLIPLASISGGDLVCRNIDVGDPVTSLADVNIYGATALPGDNALYVEGGVTCDGGLIHGFTAGVIPVAGINTGRIDMLQAGFNLLHPLVGAITTGAAMAITAGGAIEIAAGGFVEVNASTIQCINTSQGNKNTTLQTGFLTIDPDLGATSSIKLFNTLGGGVEIDGGSNGSLTGFSTVRGANLSTINLNVSTINGLPWDISGGGGNTFPNGIVIQTGAAARLIDNDNNVEWGQSILLVNDVSTLLPLPMSAQYFFAADVSGGLLKSGYYGGDGIYFQGSNGTGDGKDFLIVNDAAVGATGFPFQLEGISTINGIPFTGGGGGGGSNFPEGLTVGSSIQSKIYWDTWNWGAEILSIGDVSTNQTNPLAATYFLSFEWDGSNSSTQRSGYYGSDSIFYQGLAGAGNNSKFLSVNDAAIDVSGFPFQLDGISTINGQPYVPGGGGGGGSNFDTIFVSTISSLREINSLNQSLIMDFSTMTAVYNEGVNPNGFIRLGGGGAFDTYIKNIDGLPGISTIRIETANILTDGVLDVSGTLQANAIIADQALFNSISTTTMNISSIVLADQDGVETGASSIFNVSFGYQLSSFPFKGGMAFENYFGGVVDNFDFRLVGNGDGSEITSWTANRSTLANLFLNADEINLEVVSNVTIGDISGGGSLTVIYPSGVLTVDALSSISSINDFDTSQCYAMLRQQSTMKLYQNSTTLLYCSSIGVISNCDVSGSEIQPLIDGVYRMSIETQLNNDGSVDEVELFFLKNSSPLRNTGQVLTIENNRNQNGYYEVIEPMDGNDKIEVGLYTRSNDVYISTIVGDIIAGFAATLTINKIT